MVYCRSFITNMFYFCFSARTTWALNSAWSIILFLKKNKGNPSASWLKLILFQVNRAGVMDQSYRRRNGPTTSSVELSADMCAASMVVDAEMASPSSSINGTVNPLMNGVSSVNLQFPVSIERT